MDATYPGWNFVAFLVLNVKFNSAIQDIENKRNIIKHFKYSYPLGWAVALCFFYTWIPVIGIITYFVCFVMYWIKIGSTSKQLKEINKEAFTTVNIDSNRELQ